MDEMNASRDSSFPTTEMCMACNYKNAQCFQETRQCPLRLMKLRSLSGLVLKMESAVPFYGMYVGVLPVGDGAIRDRYKRTYISQDGYDIRVDVTSTDSQHF
jgi:hypothetical protein